MKTYNQLAQEAAQAFKIYFHERRRTAETLHQLEPAAALVIYGSVDAWRQHKEPVTIIPFASI